MAYPANYGTLLFNLDSHIFFAIRHQLKTSSPYSHNISNEVEIFLKLWILRRILQVH